jgi:transcriptional regulator with XRE-family HTH domain
MRNVKTYPSIDAIQRGWADTIRRERSARAWTLDVMAELLDVDRSTVNRWETCRVAVPDAAKVRLAGLFGKRIEDLFPWPSARPPMPRPRAARKVAA